MAQRRGCLLQRVPAGNQGREIHLLVGGQGDGPGVDLDLRRSIATAPLAPGQRGAERGRVVVGCASTTRPPAQVAAMASCTASLLPAISNATAAPSPTSARRAPGSAASAGSATAAPRAAAAARRCGSGSNTVTGPAPDSWSNCTSSSPDRPARPPRPAHPGAHGRDRCVNGHAQRLQHGAVRRRSRSSGSAVQQLVRPGHELAHGPVLAAVARRTGCSGTGCGSPRGRRRQVPSGMAGSMATRWPRRGPVLDHPGRLVAEHQRVRPGPRRRSRPRPTSAGPSRRCRWP